jgi:hypothetical protein
MKIFFIVEADSNFNNHCVMKGYGTVSHQLIGNKQLLKNLHFLA